MEKRWNLDQLYLSFQDQSFLNDIETFCSLANLKLQHSGYGYVVTQDIAAGTILDVNNMVLTVQLN